MTATSSPLPDDYLSETALAAATDPGERGCVDHTDDMRIEANWLLVWSQLSAGVHGVEDLGMSA